MEINLDEILSRVADNTKIHTNITRIDFQDMEHEIEFAENALEYWKNYLELHSTLVTPDKLQNGFDQVANLQEFIDRLYERWAELEEDSSI